MARPSSVGFEPPGETRTLLVDENLSQTLTAFDMRGCMCRVDGHRRHTGIEDVFTKRDMCRAQDAGVGLGGGDTDRFRC